MKEDQDDEISDRDTMRELADTPRTDARCAESQQLKTMAMRFAWMCDHARTLERELAGEVAANEAGRVVDAMTPEQVDAYLVSMGVNLDEMRAHTAEMRKKLEVRLSSLKREN
jgi:hypothetical protein